MLRGKRPVLREVTKQHYVSETVIPFFIFFGKKNNEFKLVEGERNIVIVYEGRQICVWERRLHKTFVGIVDY